jgi:hypothetical protein
LRWEREPGRLVTTATWQPAAAASARRAASEGALGGLDRVAGELLARRHARVLSHESVMPGHGPVKSPDLLSSS